MNKWISGAHPNKYGSVSKHVMTEFVVQRGLLLVFSRGDDGDAKAINDSEHSTPAVWRSLVEKVNET